VKWESGEVGEESVEGRRRIWSNGKWECMKNSPKMQHIWHLGTSIGDYRPMSYILRKLFSGTTFQS